MLICPECNEKVNESLEYCSVCGCPIAYIKDNQPQRESKELICPECNGKVNENSEYCPSCGCPINYIKDNQSQNESKKLICPECNEKVDANSEYCPVCGCPINYIKDNQLKEEQNELICPECSNKISPNDEYCSNCGCPVEFIIENQIVEYTYSASTDISKLKSGVKANNPEAMYWLAYCYYQGINGLDEDENKAEELLKKSASLGYEKAKTDYQNWFGEVPETFDNFEIHKIEEKYPLKKLFNRYDSIIVVDTETSGLDYKNNRIIELASVQLVCNRGNIVIKNRMDKLVKLPAGTRLDYKITEITGITYEQLINNGYDSKTVFSEFVNMIGNEKVLLVAYNAQFDLSFLFYSLVREGMEGVLQQIEMLDALTIFKDRRSYPHKLQDAIFAYGLESVVQNTHRAIDDTFALIEILKAMDNECDDLDKYINLFGYNPKYGVNGSRIRSVTYLPQPYNSFKKLYL